jgi:hypothetical protein
MSIYFIENCWARIAGLGHSVRTGVALEPKQCGTPWVAGDSRSCLLERGGWKRCAPGNAES